MKKKIFALIISLCLTFGAVPAYAQAKSNFDSVPITQYSDALSTLYTANFAYLLRASSSDLLLCVDMSPLQTEPNSMRKDELLISINNINYNISSLESANYIITENQLEEFYGIQPAIAELISSSKLFVEGCNRVYNKDPNGYYIASSAISSIYDSQFEISKYCDNINGLSIQYLSTIYGLQ